MGASVRSGPALLLILACVPLNARREVSRPSGLSISYSQLNKDCDLSLRWHRERVARNNIGIFLIYGSALHHGIELFMKRVARTPNQAVQAASAYLQREIRAPQRRRLPLQWELPPETLKDGSISKAKNNYGKLWCQEICDYWLSRQIPLWIERYGHLEFLRTEHRMFVPMRREEHWKNDWSFEAVLDLECKGDLICDLKSTSEPWDEADVKKYSMQAHLYMAAYYVTYGREPTFKFLVLPRCYDADVCGPAARLDEFEVKFDLDYSQQIIDGVVRPRVNMIEAGIFAANPTSRLCNERWCPYHYHCKFGSGTHL